MNSIQTIKQSSGNDIDMRLWRLERAASEKRQEEVNRTLLRRMH